ncbi:MAG TPA: primosomal protein N' [Candidatus Acidoferrum sp.]|nr:primosomal protein N' [Candidatus Acidoferrum sp.]
MIAKVAVDLRIFSIDKAYDYLLPAAFDEVAKPGMRVIVPFGSGNRRMQGLILSLEETTQYKGVKEVAQLLDDEPLLTPSQLAMLHFVRERCFCTFFDVLRTMLPAGIRYEPADILEVVAPSPGDEELIGTIARLRAPTVERLSAELGRPVAGDVARLLAAGALRKKAVRTGLSEGTVRKMARLAVSSEEASDYIRSLGPSGKKHERALDVLLTGDEVPANEVCYLAGVTGSVLQTLAKRGLVELFEREVVKNPYAGKLVNGVSAGPIDLTDEQRKATDGIARLMDAKEPAVALLFGVTGSGKTLCYLSLIDRMLEQGRGAIVLVPEIVLTPQLTDRFIGRYGDKVAVLHSGLAAGERRDAWKRIRKGECRIVVGTRSAVFAPVENLGLIVMDEEQDSAYKSESTPRYHARTVAKFRAANENCTLLLCSATPSVESYAAAKDGKYHLFTLDNRYTGAGLPKVIVTNLRDELSAAISSVTGPTLAGELQKTLDEGKQAILFLNRRGYNTFLSCRECGAAVTCDNCSVSMTYHAANGLLMCHYCGKTVEVPPVCPTCHHGQLLRRGFGTQRVEEEISRLFPDARLLRMDTDTTSYKMSHEEMLLEFAGGRYDILIGTQMVTKGLDLPNVRLVGVLFADSLLLQDDFRASERAFALLTQVVGRAGRADTPGLAVIETFVPENAVIELARRQDYIGFFEGEIAFRRTAVYPPYCDIYHIVFSGEDETKTRGASEFFVNHLSNIFKREQSHSIIMTKALPAPMSRIGGKYRFRTLIKCRDNAALRQLLGDAYAGLLGDKAYTGVTCAIDLNPYSVT